MRRVSTISATPAWSTAIGSDDLVEIGFTVSKAVRTSRFHDPENLSAKERVIDYNTSANAIWMDGTKARDFFRRHHVFCTYVEPGENRTFQVNLEPGYFVLRYGPGFIVDPSSDNRVERIGITHRDGRPAEPTQTVAPGSLTYNLTNASPARIIAYALSIQRPNAGPTVGPHKASGWEASCRVRAFRRRRHSSISSRRKR